MGLDELAGRLDTAAATLAGSATTLDRLDPGPRVFGGDAPGRLGAFGRRAHAALTAGLAARAQEAAAHAGRLTDAGHALRVAAERYADAEHGVADRHATGDA